MKKIFVSKEKLHNFISKNEVVFQVFGELVEVANDKEEKNRMNLLNNLASSSSIEVYEKDHWYIKEEFQDINDWSKKDDVLFLLEKIGVLVCITRKEAIENKLIAA